MVGQHIGRTGSVSRYTIHSSLAERRRYSKHQWPPLRIYLQWEIHFPTVVINKLSSTLPGAAIFFEFKHYKPKKRFTSTKCFAFMEMDEIKPGPIVIELWVHWRASLSTFWGILKYWNMLAHYLLEIQVQEAHGLQEEETAASNKETALSPPSSDVTQGQLSRCTPRTSFKPHPFLTSTGVPPRRIQQY